MVRKIRKQIAGVFKSLAQVIEGTEETNPEKNWVHVASWYPETKKNNDFD